MSTHIDVHEARKEAAAFAGKVLQKNYTEVQDMAWRSIQNGEKNTNIAILCIETCQKWIWLIEELLSISPFQNEITIYQKQTVCFVTGWEICNIIADLFPTNSAVLQTKPSGNLVRTLVLTHKGLVVFEITPKTSASYN